MPFAENWTGTAVCRMAADRRAAYPNILCSWRIHAEITQWTTIAP